MEFFRAKSIIPFMRYSIYTLVISWILVAASLVLLFTKGLNYGIDFVGGTVIQVKYEGVAPIDDMRHKLSSNPIYDGSSISEFGSPDEVVIRMKSVSESLTQDVGDLTTIQLEGTGKFEIRRVDIVGAKVGSELREKGITALILALIGMLAYVSYRYEWRFALAAILGLLHDITIVVGIISLVGLDVNLDVLAAVLTVLGYSINDTIIVFDRIRERINDAKKMPLNETINEAITSTLSRTILTSFTTLIVVVTLYLYGGEIINPFTFVLLLGIGIGTFSSVFIASALLPVVGFDINKYRSKIADKKARAAEREKMRAQFEQGII